VCSGVRPQGRLVALARNGPSTQYHGYMLRVFLGDVLKPNDGVSCKISWSAVVGRMLTQVCDVWCAN